MIERWTSSARLQKHYNYYTFSTLAKCTTDRGNIKCLSLLQSTDTQVEKKTRSHNLINHFLRKIREKIDYWPERRTFGFELCGDKWEMSGVPASVQDDQNKADKRAVICFGSLHANHKLRPRSENIAVYLSCTKNAASINSYKLKALYVKTLTDSAVYFMDSI